MNYYRFYGGLMVHFILPLHQDRVLHFEIPFFRINTKRNINSFFSVLRKGIHRGGRDANNARR